MRALVILSLPALVLVLNSCRHQVDTTHEVEVKPMHLTVDVNIKVDKALDDYFSDIDARDDTMKTESEKEGEGK